MIEEPTSSFQMVGRAGTLVFIGIAVTVAASLGSCTKITTDIMLEQEEIVLRTGVKGNCSIHKLYGTR